MYSADARNLLCSDAHSSIIGRLERRSTTSYTPFGLKPRSHGTSLGFNGALLEQRLECYLLGNGYRAYMPQLMRFNSPDSLSPFGRGGLNAYAYCYGDPINRTDSSGHMPTKLSKNMLKMIEPAYVRPHEPNNLYTYAGKFRYLDDMEIGAKEEIAVFLSILDHPLKRAKPLKLISYVAASKANSSGLTTAEKNIAFNLNPNDIHLEKLRSTLATPERSHFGHLVDISLSAEDKMTRGISRQILGNLGYKYGPFLTRGEEAYSAMSYKWLTQRRDLADARYMNNKLIRTSRRAPVIANP